MLVLKITQWGHRPTHFYGTIRDDGEIVQEILRCGTKQRVIEIAKKWAGERPIQIPRKVEYF